MAWMPKAWSSKGRKKADWVPAYFKRLREQETLLWRWMYEALEKLSPLIILRGSRPPSLANSLMLPQPCPKWLGS